MPDKFIKIGACWKNKKTGYSCVLDDNDEEVPLRFQIFKNKHKKEDKHPDLVMGYFIEDADDNVPF